MAETPQVAPKSVKAKEYESIYVLRPDVDAEIGDKVANRVSDVISRAGGKLVKVESWGRRKLAYPVRKYRKGIYMYVKFVAVGDLVAELERNFRMQQDSVLKFMTIKLGDQIILSDVQIDPEEVKFPAIEPPAPEDEVEETREKLLGLVDLGDRRDRMMDRRDHMRDDFSDMDDDDSAGADDSEEK